jgi:KEOPS complex subunit Pcc1
MSMGRKQAYAIIHLDFPSENYAKIIYEAIKPETKTSPTPRAKVKLRRDANNLVLTFKARDAAALRASINSILRFTNSLMQILNVIKKIHTQ